MVGINNGSRIQLLECTCRDGALGLEDAWLNQLSSAAFSSETRSELAQVVADIHSEIVEIGSLEISPEDKKRFDIYQNIEEASLAIPQNRSKEQIFCAMFRGPDTPLADIPVRNDTLLDGVRVIVRYSELQKSLDFCAHLVRCGYKVFIQPMATMRYSAEELRLLINSANAMQAYALYFVDSYGYMLPEDVLRFFTLFDQGLDPEIRLGFHAHNNLSLAFANAITFLQHESDRHLIVDATASGMGQGAGNLQTEIIAAYLNRFYGKNYNYAAVLEACELVEPYNRGIWGYSVDRAVSALHQCAYKYATEFRHRYGLNYREMDQVFSCMPPEYRHRYTAEFARDVLKITGFADKLRES